MMAKRLEEFVPDSRVVDERGPTKERIEKAWGSLDVGDTGTLTVRQNPIERGVSRGMFTREQGRAAEKLYGHWYRSGIGHEIGSPDWMRVLAGDGAYGGMARSETQAFHRQRLRAAYAVVKTKVDGAGMSGDDAVKALEYVACRDMTFEEAGRKIGYASEKKAEVTAIMLVHGGLNILVAEWGI